MRALYGPKELADFVLFFLFFLFVFFCFKAAPWEWAAVRCVKTVCSLRSNLLRNCCWHISPAIPTIDSRYALLYTSIRTKALTRRHTTPQRYPSRNCCWPTSHVTLIIDFLFQIHVYKRMHNKEKAHTHTHTQQLLGIISSAEYKSVICFFLIIIPLFYSLCSITWWTPPRCSVMRSHP